MKNQKPEERMQQSKWQASVVKLILDGLRSIENGSITIIIQDEDIIQINRNETFKIAG